MKKNLYITFISLIIYMFFSLKNLILFNDYFNKQIIWYIVGFILFLFMLKINKRKIYIVSLFLYIFLVGCLIYVLLKNQYINGSRAWIKLGFLTFQPSEFMKIILIIVLNFSAYYNFNILKLFIITLIPAILTFLEPDTGNVIFYFIILLTVLFFYHKKFVIFFLSVLFILIVLILYLYRFYPDIIIMIFKDKIFYRMDRILNFDNYQLKRSLISIGSTNFVLGNKNLINVPFATTDFAFSLLVTINGFYLTILYLINNIICNINISIIGKKKIGLKKYITYTFLIMKLVQETINIFMNIGLCPITGITLPLISYGGSSIIIYFIMFGLINNMVDCNMVDMDYIQQV